MSGSPFSDSLLKVFFGFWAVLSLVFLGAALTLTRQETLVWAYFPVSLGLHLALYALMVRFRHTWVYSLDGRPMTSVGWPNALTLFRLSSLPALAFLFYLTRQEPSLAPLLIVWVSLAFLTDLLDGWLSRRLAEVSECGKLLDGGTDYLVLFTLVLVLGLSGVLPWWLFLLVLGRIGVQALGQLILSLRFGRIFAETTYLGKASFFALMVLFAVELLVFFRLPGTEGHWMVAWLEGVAGALTGLAIFDKLWYFRSRWMRPEGDHAHE